MSSTSPPFSPLAAIAFSTASLGPTPLFINSKGVKIAPAHRKISPPGRIHARITSCLSSLPFLSSYMSSSKSSFTRESIGFGFLGDLTTCTQVACGLPLWLVSNSTRVTVARVLISRRTPFWLDSKTSEASRSRVGAISSPSFKKSDRLFHEPSTAWALGPTAGENPTSSFASAHALPYGSENPIGVATCSRTHSNALSTIL
mmetsp:Transcript_40293/g.100844  ORF Transcript_40293/g.100844 Transcript_40293/m.100844 type:complete len:202 (+) Transcript_40293:2457-3062(+)